MSREFLSEFRILCVRARARVCACVRVCVRACVCVCACIQTITSWRMLVV